MKNRPLHSRRRPRRAGVCFQPILQLTSGALVGHEAIGVPSAFAEGAPLAEPEELIEIAHERRVLAELLHYWHVDALAVFAWQDPTGESQLWLNTDTRILESPNFEPGMMERLLDLHGLPRDRVVVELTEPSGDVMHPRLAELVAWYRSLGVAIALDRFGSAPDSAWAIGAYRPAYVKLAPHLVQGIGGDTASLRAVQAIVHRCRSAAVTPVALGIETLYELRVLQEAGVRLGQGMLVGAPLPNPDVPSPRVRDTLALLSKDLAPFQKVPRCVLAGAAEAW